MAIMYPQHLPISVKSNAEKTLFLRLQESLPDDYTIIWSLSWIIKRDTNYGGTRESEIDFVILHPQHGILVLEVKGGGIGYDSTSGEWYSINNEGKHIIKNPFEQAQTGMHVLKRHFTQSVPSLLLKSKCKNCTFGHGVVFPNVDDNSLSFRKLRPEEMILDRNKIKAEAIENAIELLYKLQHNTYAKPLGADAIKEIIKIYADSWYVRPPLIDQFEQEEAQLEILTEEQFDVLRTLRMQNRVAIHGCAGSGKTFLAIEQARRLAMQGKRVLLTCFNRNLADWIQKLVDKQAHAETSLDNIDVYNVHRFSYKLCSQVGIKLSNDVYSFDTAYSEGLQKAVKLTDIRYDAIIVDEGQDFSDNFWKPLLALLKSEESSFYIFYDDNQSIYNRNPRYPIPVDRHFSLPTNCRTTQSIHQAIMKYYNGDAPRCKGPKGEEVKLIHTYQDHEQSELANLVEDLTRRNKIPLENIVVLTPASKQKSRFKDGLLLGNHLRLSWQVESSSELNKLACCTVASFKGLERSVVILVELEKFGGLDPLSLIYVAFSRAKLYLVLLGDVVHSSYFSPYNLYGNLDKHPF